jgi:hypothetical protein
MKSKGKIVVGKDKQCCCGCGRDASGSHHSCSITNKPCMAFCQITPEGDENFASKYPCNRCSLTADKSVRRRSVATASESVLTSATKNSNKSSIAADLGSDVSAGGSDYDDNAPPSERIRDSASQNCFTDEVLNCEFMEVSDWRKATTDSAKLPSTGRNCSSNANLKVGESKKRRVKKATVPEFTISWVDPIISYLG